MATALGGGMGTGAQNALHPFNRPLVRQLQRRGAKCTCRSPWGAAREVWERRSVSPAQGLGQRRWVLSTVWCFFFLSSRSPILLLKINSVARASHSYVCALLPLLLTHTPLPTNPNHQSLTPPLVAAPALLLPPQPKPPTPPAAAPPRAAGPKRGARAAWGAIGTPDGTAPPRSTGAAPSLFLFCL